MEITLGNAMCTQTKRKAKCFLKGCLVFTISSECCPAIANALNINKLKMKLNGKTSSYTVGVFVLVHLRVQVT